MENPQIADKAAKRCAAKRKDGQPCGASPVRGLTLCAGHAGLGIGQDMEGARRKSAEVRKRDAAARKETRRKSVLDVMAEAVAAHAGELTDAYLEASAKGDWRAADALVNRVYGKPTERVEQSSGDELTDDERAAIRRRLVESYPQLKAA